MKKLEIRKKDGFLYTLSEKTGKEYILNIELQGINTLPKEGDYIYISEELLDKNYKEYSSMYCFGPLYSKYGRVIKDEFSPDLIGININGNITYLQRYYG